MSIRNSPPIGWRHRRFLRNQIIHHFQTRITLFDHHKNCLSTIRFYIILKQTGSLTSTESSLSTIRFYIILKPEVKPLRYWIRLSTIRFYIILKLVCIRCPLRVSLSTIRFYIILKPPELETPPDQGLMVYK